MAQYCLLSELPLISAAYVLYLTNIRGRLMLNLLFTHSLKTTTYPDNLKECVIWCQQVVHPFNQTRQSIRVEPQLLCQDLITLAQKQAGGRLPQLASQQLQSRHTSWSLACLQ